jgi:peptidoglycan/xylan/chitin deacetylase (PgdA/CDA1 family)
MAKAIVTTSWDDGHPLDLRVADMLERYHVPATFYLPVERTKRGCMGPDGMSEIGRRFDVGGHTYHHVNLRTVSPGRARQEIAGGKSRIEDIVGRSLACFCYPYGGYNGQVVEEVRAAGFLGARTTRCLSRTMGDPFRMGPTIHAKDWWFGPYLRDAAASRDIRLLLYMLGKNLFLKGWDDVALATLDFVIANGGVWHLYGHSWEIDSSGDWARLERVLQGVSARADNVRPMDNSELIRSYSGRV